MRRLGYAAVGMAGALLVALLLSEAASRTLRRFVCEGRGTVFHSPHPEYGLGHAPSMRGINQGCLGRAFEFRVEVETNSRGLVGAREFSEGPAAGTTRVLVLGDSVAEAAQVPRGTGFVERVGAELGGRHPGLEVLNSGTAGYSLHNQVAFFRAEGSGYSPHVVLSVFNLQNDAGEISPPLQRRDYGAIDAFATANLSVAADGMLAIDAAPWRDAARRAANRADERGRAADFLLRNFYLVRRVARLFEEPSATPAAAQAAASMLPTMTGHYVEPLPPEWQEAWALVEAAWRTLARDVAARGARLLVVVLPAREQVVDARWDDLARGAGALLAPPQHLDREGPHRRVMAIAARLGLEVLDLSPAIRAQVERGGPSGYFEFDLHPNETGHARIAEALAPWLGERLARGPGAGTLPAASAAPRSAAVRPGAADAN